MAFHFGKDQSRRRSNNERQAIPPLNDRPDPTRPEDGLLIRARARHVPTRGPRRPVGGKKSGERKASNWSLTINIPPKEQNRRSASHQIAVAIESFPRIQIQSARVSFDSSVSPIGFCGNGGSEQRGDAVPRGAGVEAVRGALRQHRPPGPLLLRVRPGRPRLRSRPQGAPGHDAPGRRWLPLPGVPQRLPGRRFQYPGSLPPPLLPPPRNWPPLDLDSQTGLLGMISIGWVVFVR